MNIPPPDANFAAALAWLVGTAAAATALGVIIRYVRRAVHWAIMVAQRIDTILVLSDHSTAILNRELTVNGGSSMRDKVDQQCAAIRALQADRRRDTAAGDTIHTTLLMELAELRTKIDDMWYRMTGLR